MDNDWISRVPHPDDYLSNANPLATLGQRRIEDKAIALMQRPDLQQARKVIEMMWNNVAGWPAREQADLQPVFVEEYLFHHVIRAVNGDHNRPEVVRFMVPPHRWLGRDVPGSRWAGDCSDFVIRNIPIAHGGRYELRGVQTCETRPICFYSLMGDNTAAPQTIALLEGLDMEYESDGSFTITIDNTPAEGRSNHIQTMPGADFMMIRDSIGDWLAQSANALTITRLDPSGPPPDDDQMAQRAMRIAFDGLYYTYFISRMGNSTAPNAIKPPESSAAFGAVASQWGTISRIDLTEDQAIIVRCNAAGAGFRNLQLWNLFQMTIDYWSRTSSINMAQMLPDADGDFTFVISNRDPGVANWLDTMDRRELIFGQRWQGFDRDGDHPDPWMTTTLVAFSDLETALPAGVPQVDAEGRRAQIAMRQAGFASRFVDS